MFRTLLSLLAATTLVSACKKKESPPSPGGAPPTPKESAPKDEPAPSGPFAAWDLGARRKAWQGAHVTPGHSLGMWHAIDVKGDKVVVWDGKEEKTLDFALASPCEAKFTEVSADGGKASTISHYTVKDGALIVGLGDAGSRKGKEAIACVSNLLVTLDAAGTCTEWKASMFDDGTYKQEPGTCRWITEGDKELFGVTIRGYESKLVVDGDALMSEQMTRTHSESAADFAAAKIARDAKAN